jgi:ABC-2 type transport system ATP-binding protein
MESVLKLDRITKVFKTGFIPKKVIALDQVSLEVSRGEIFGLLGPNGAGKTTTIKCILGLIYVDSGRIELMGNPIPSMKAQARIGFLSENPYVYDFLTGREYLIFAASLHGYNSTECKKKADKLLAQFHIEEAADRQLKKYSKGMLQRIGLAQALINDPEFLILDEPMSGLDPVGRKEVRDLLISLKNDGKTILFSSHILGDAELLCDHVAILVNGKLQTIGKLQALIKKVEGYEVTLNNVSDGNLRDIAHELITTSQTGSLIRVHTIEALQALIAASRAEKFEIESIIPQRQTLEDLYLKRMK